MQNAVNNRLRQTKLCKTPSTIGNIRENSEYLYNIHTIKITINVG